MKNENKSKKKSHPLGSSHHSKKPSQSNKAQKKKNAIKKKPMQEKKAIKRTFPTSPLVQHHHLPRPDVSYSSQGP
jgi:hypothetical protein